MRKCFLDSHFSHAEERSELKNGQVLKGAQRGYVHCLGATSTFNPQPSRRKWFSATPKAAFLRQKPASASSRSGEWFSGGSAR